MNGTTNSVKATVHPARNLLKPRGTHLQYPFNQELPSLHRIHLLAATPLLALSLSAATPSASVTFTHDVAPILYQHCVACHHPNDIAPMSLLTYKEARPWI